MKSIQLPQKTDWVASLVAFVLAVPLSFGIAAASGVPPAAGLISAIIGALVVSTIGSSRFLITAPEASLIALIVYFVSAHGLMGLAAITFLAGVIQIGFGLAKMGRWVNLIPGSILYGLLSAIGIILISGQIHVFMGSPVVRSVPESVSKISDTLIYALNYAEFFVHPALICGSLSLATMIFWPKMPGSRLKKIPAPLPAIIVGTLAAFPWEMPRISLAPVIPTLSHYGAEFVALGWMSKLSDYLLPAAALALVGSAQSLLSATALDKVSTSANGASKTNLDRELIAAGVGNSLAGALGGIPITGAMVRSSATLNAGAKTRWSVTLHGIWLVLGLTFFAGIFKLIPLTVLAAVLLVTGARLINQTLFLQTWKTNPADGLRWAVTCVGILATDLLLGLGIALVFSTVIRFAPTSGPVTALITGIYRRITS